LKWVVILHIRRFFYLLLLLSSSRRSTFRHCRTTFCLYRLCRSYRLQRRPYFLSTACDPPSSCPSFPTAPPHSSRIAREKKMTASHCCSFYHALTCLTPVPLSAFSSPCDAHLDPGSLLLVPLVSQPPLTPSAQASLTPLTATPVLPPPLLARFPALTDCKGPLRRPNASPTVQRPTLIRPECRYSGWVPC
jgi:hypothetical protein